MSHFLCFYLIHANSLFMNRPLVHCDFPSLEQTVSTTFKPDVVPAVNRWLKKAGNEGKLPLACPLGCLFKTESTESCPVLTFLCFTNTP